MARPGSPTVASGDQDWDVEVDAGFENLYDGPIPVHEHTGDESDINSSFTASSFDRCFVWVNHSTKGWLLYFSDGSSWTPFCNPAEDIGVLTDSTGGSASSTLSAHASFGDVDDSVASLVAQLNDIRTKMRDRGLME